MAHYDDIEILERKAAEDLLSAEILLNNNDELLSQIGFHLQQFTEKKMKTILLRKHIDYPKTHDLLTILNLFPQERITEEDELFAYVLSRFAVESRYHDHFSPPMDGQQMLERTKKFVGFIETLWEDP